MTEYDTKRATGRTTGLMLQALGKAVENPGTTVEFIDHHQQNGAQLQYCKERIEKIAKQLNLDVSVNNWTRVNTNNTADYGLYVKSNWVSPYSRTPVEEAFKKVYGAYPVIDDDFSCWNSFKKGFEAAQKTGETK